MLRIYLLIIISVFIISCAANKNENQKFIKLSSGKTVETFFEKHTSPETETVFLVESSTDEKILKEETIEKDILEIWSEVEKIADEKELNEAIIKYRFVIEDLDEKGEPEKHYIVKIFTAEKIENGKWKIDKIN